MNKILVLSTGWHFSSHFYENMIKQIVPDDWEADYFCVAHRMPEDDNVIKEKNDIRNAKDENFLIQLDKMMYDYPITREQIEDFGWKFMLEENTVGDMEVFNQWSEKHDYKEYDFILVTHDDNFILSDRLFIDVLNNKIKLYKPIVESKYGQNGHQFNVEIITNDEDWLFLDNGYTENIPKAFTPRGSFSFYKKELIDLLPNNKFDMYQEGGLGIVNRVGETDSIGHDGIAAWNTHAGTFRDFLYDSDLVDNTRWLSDKKRVSKYCIEGERGFIHNYRADGVAYVNDVKNLMDEIGWI
tara:strand:- start:1280 stop:2173 length:894 start_codon:yes stop_codon:yes gene_type:complete